MYDKKVIVVYKYGNELVNEIIEKGSFYFKMYLIWIVLYFVVMYLIKNCKDCVFFIFFIKNYWFIIGFM